MAVFVFCAEMLWWLLASNKTPNTNAFIVSVAGGLSSAFFWAVVFWALYVALEPLVRRRWPQSMITWTRLLGGGWRDPLVGGHLLMGVAFAFGIEILGLVRGFTPDSVPTNTKSLSYVLNTPRMIATLLGDLIYDIGIILFVFLTFFLLRMLVRKQWIAVTVVILLNTVLSNASSAVDVALATISMAALLFILLRFGVLPLIAFAFTSSLMGIVPINFGAWYAGSWIFLVSVVLALTAYALHTALAGRPLFKFGFLE